MLLECQHCGAPLDVKPGAETNKCRYCGRTQQVRRLKTIAQETPADWKPPQRWRPPPQAEAPSDVELKYQGDGGKMGCILATIIFGSIGAVLLFAMTRPGGPLAAISMEKLDKVDFNEKPKEMEDKLGGSFHDSARWLRVDLRGPWRYLVISWDEADMTHPRGFSAHDTDRKECNAEVTAIRKKLRDHLGPRFDGTSWRWGTVSLHLDEKCASFSINASIPRKGDDEDKGDWKLAIEALWKLARADGLGRPTKGPSEEEMRTLHGGGYEPSKVGALIVNLTIDDARKTLDAKFPGTLYRTSGGLTAEIPLSHRKFGSADLRFENKKGGGLQAADLRTYHNKLGDHVGYARCLAKESGGELSVTVSDYAKKTQSASVKLPGLQANVTDYGIHAYSSGSDLIGSKGLRSLFEAVSQCTE